MVIRIENEKTHPKGNNENNENAPRMAIKKWLMGEIK